MIMYMVYGNGAVLGFGATLSPRIGVTVCGAAFGYLIGMLINLTVIMRFVDQTSIASRFTVFLFVIIFAVLSVPLYDYAVIISSCTFGSYMAWRVSKLKLLSVFLSLGTLDDGWGFPI